MNAGTHTHTHTHSNPESQSQKEKQPSKDTHTHNKHVKYSQKPTQTHTVCHKNTHMWDRQIIWGGGLIRLLFGQSGCHFGRAGQSQNIWGRQSFGCKVRASGRWQRTSSSGAWWDGWDEHLCHHNHHHHHPHHHPRHNHHHHHHDHHHLANIGTIGTNTTIIIAFQKIFNFQLGPGREEGLQFQTPNIHKHAK